MQTKYITGRTWYDEAKEGYATDIGTVKKDGSPNKLLCSTWGDTPEMSKSQAEDMVELLNNAANN